MSAHDAPAAAVAGAFPDAWAVVLTAPAGRGLGEAEIDAARRAAACEDYPARRLGPAAAEFAAPIGGVERSLDWAALLPGVDVNCLPAEGRRKRVLVADMDSTMIGVECIDEIADLAGIKPQVAEITERAMQGELGFEDALAERVALLEGLEEAALARVAEERIRLTPGARALVRSMTASGAATALVSGGFTWFSERVAAAAGFASHRANGLAARDGRLTGETVPPILGRAAKLERMRALMAAGGYGAEAVVAVGDGANDAAMVEAAGLGVAFRAKPALAEIADARLVHSDLAAVAALAGLETG